MNVSGDYYTKKIKTYKKVINGITYHYETDINYTPESDVEGLYFTGGIPVGTDTIYGGSKSYTHYVSIYYFM